MKKYMTFSHIIAACAIALAAGAPGTFSRAEGTIADKNLEKLKQTNSCRGCDLSGLTLNRMNLAGADLEGADFSRTKFFLSNLSGANLKGANLRGASFGGTDLSEANLRGADLRGASLEGAYLDQTLLEGEFITAKPYEDIGVTDVEKQVYVPNPDKPKPTPETRDVKVATQKVEPVQASPVKEVKSSPEKTKSYGSTANVAERRPGAPAAKKAVPLGQAIVEPQEARGEARAEQPKQGTEPVPAQDAVTDSGLAKKATTPEAPKRTAQSGKPAPKPPAQVVLDGDQPAKFAEAKAAEGEVKKPDGNAALEHAKRDRLTRLINELKCLGCDLSGVDLSGRNLKDADLEQANLTGSNLEGVNLERANLKGAILQNADLRMASLKNADLYKADLTGADLSGANIQGAKLDSVKLSTVIGLDR